jgi:hypothetical protein
MIFLDRTAWSVKKGLKKIRRYKINCSRSTGQGHMEVHEVKNLLTIYQDILYKIYACQQGKLP